MKECTYEGKTYRRNNDKWVDADHMVVPVYLQKILSVLTFGEDAISKMGYHEATEEGDKHKKSGDYNRAIKFYEQAMRSADTEKLVSLLLPRMTSCYRLQKKPEKAIEILSEAKKQYGECIISELLLTSAAAAYCDMNEPENAIRCCKWAYRVLKERQREFSLELSNVYERALRMLDPDYDREESLERAEQKRIEKALLENE